jgi:citrate lyase subunit beta/citryl-CoA lyase
MSDATPPPPNPAGAWRSVLFCPADADALVAKAPRSEPDLVVLDLEDAVPPDRKAAARDHARRNAELLLALDGGPAVAVRVNGPRTPWFADDVAAGLAPGLAAVVVPKFEHAEDGSLVAAALARAGLAGVGVMAGIETVLGVADCRQLLGPPVVACYFGAEDYVADLGGQRTPSNAEVATARSLVAMAARLAGVAALDIVVIEHGDHQRFSREAEEARALGYAGKLCIHPAQVPLARSAFTPTPEEVDRARRLIAAYQSAVQDGVGVISFEGVMVDGPVLAQAHTVLRLA